ncbi:hypothetical protein HDE_13865 [Halotydeus destructor]|nr:hypothetical protein HDE_13865 [Halotydeus destructor]
MLSLQLATSLLVLLCAAQMPLISGLVMRRPTYAEQGVDLSELQNVPFRPYFSNVLEASQDRTVSSPESNELLASPRKRSSIMLNRLKAALEHALDSSRSEQHFEQFDPNTQAMDLTTQSIPQLLDSAGGPRAMAMTMEPSGSNFGHTRASLDRRPSNRHKQALKDEEAMMKCYFNAVACF